MKTKFEKIQEQRKKARNKEILFRVDAILNYKSNAVIDVLEDIVKNLQLYNYLYPEDMEKHLLPGYKIIDTREVEKDE